MKAKNTIIGALAAVLLLTGTATSQPEANSRGHMRSGDMGEQRPGNPGGDFFQNMLPMMRMLDLSDDQRNAISEIVQSANDSLEAIRESNEPGSHREEFLQLFSASSISVSEVENLLNDRIEQMKQANAVIAEALVDIHGILTTEQLAALAALDPDALEMRGNSLGRGPGSRNTEMGVHPPR